MNKNKYKMAGPLRYMGGGHFRNKYVTGGGMYGPNVIPGAMIPGTASTVYSESTAPQQQNMNRQIANLNQGAWQDDFMKEQASRQALGSTALSAGTSALQSTLPSLINMSPKDLTYSQNVTRGWLKGNRGSYDQLAAAGAPKTTMGRTLENPGFGTGVGTAMDVAGQIGQQAWSDDDPTTFTGKEKFARMGSAAGKGMKMGAQLGSIIPGVGTAIGAAAGTTIGAWSGLLKGKKEQRQAQEELQKRNAQKAGMMNRAARFGSQQKEYSGYDFGVQRNGGLRRKYDNGGFDYVPQSQRVWSPTDPNTGNESELNFKRYGYDYIPQSVNMEEYLSPYNDSPGLRYLMGYGQDDRRMEEEILRNRYTPQTQRGRGGLRGMYRDGGHRYHKGGHRHPHTGDAARQDTVMSYIHSLPEFKDNQYRLDSKYYKKVMPRINDALRNLDNYTPTKEEYERNARLLNLINSKGDANADNFIRMFDHYKEDRPMKKKDLKALHQGVLSWYLRDGGLRRKYDGGGVFSGVESTPHNPNKSLDFDDDGFWENWKGSQEELFQESDPHNPPVNPDWINWMRKNRDKITDPSNRFEGNPWEINKRLWMEGSPHINNRLKEHLNPFSGPRSMYRGGGMRRKYDGGGVMSGMYDNVPGNEWRTEGRTDSKVMNALFGSPEDAAETTLDTWGMFYPPAAWGGGLKDFGKAFNKFKKGNIFPGVQDVASGLLSFVPGVGPVVKNTLKSTKLVKNLDKANDKVNKIQDVVNVADPGFAYEREVPADYFTADYFKAGENPFKYDTPKYWEWKKAKRSHSLYGK